MPRGKAATTTKKKTPDELEQESLDWLNFAASSAFVNPLDANRGKTARLVSKDQISKWLLNPQANFESLQNLSQLFKTNSGIYKRLIEYFAFILTYDYMIIPTVGTSLIKNKSKIKKSFEESGLRIDKLEPKTNLPIFAKQLFDEGEGFYYKIEDSSGIVYKQIPNKYCLPYKKINNVYRFVIDMQKFVSNSDIESFPTEIQRAVELYNDKNNKALFIGGQYYEVSDKGVCFTFNNNGGHAIPPFANIFEDLINLTDNKELQAKVDKLENTKMIHNKIPLNKDSKPICDPSLAKKYNEAIKNNLDDGIFSIVNPFESQTLTLNNNSQRTITLVSEAINQIFDDSGTSNMLFNNQKASSEALKRSIIVDVVTALNLIVPMFSNYLTYELLKVKDEIKWECRVMEYTWFDRDEKRKLASNELSLGGSIMNYWSTLGLSPIQGLNLHTTENILGLENVLTIKGTAHTLSGGVDNQGGKPNNEDKGIESSDITEQVNDLGN